MAYIPLVAQVVDLSGNPAAGCKAYFYQAGTTTPQATKTDSTGATNDTNPVVGNSGGIFVTWMDDTLTYKIVIKDSADSTTYYSQDNVDPSTISGLLAIHTGVSDQSLLTTSDVTFNNITASATMTALAAVINGITIDPTGASVGQALGFPNSTTTVEAYTPAGGGDVLSTANGSDFADIPTVRTNLGVAIGTDVQAVDDVDVVRLSDTLTLDGVTDQYTAFKSLVGAAHTKKKKIIFDGLCAVDFSAGTITLGGPQEWVVEKRDFSQGLKVLGVKTTTDLASIKIDDPFELSKDFYINAASVSATNTTVLPPGTFLFYIGAQCTFRGKAVGVLNASATTGTGTGLSFSKAQSAPAFDNLLFEDFDFSDWWRGYFSSNSDTASRNNYIFRNGKCDNFGIAPFVVNMPGAKATNQNDGVLYQNLKFNNCGMDIDATVICGASGCKNVRFEDIQIDGTFNTGISLEEMDGVLIKHIYGEPDFSTYTTNTNALIHVKANNVASGSYVSNTDVVMADVRCKQVGDLTGNNGGVGILISGDVSSSTPAVVNMDVSNLHLKGFRNGYQGDNQEDDNTTITVRDSTIDKAGVTGAGNYGIVANQINSDWTNIKVIGYAVGARSKRGGIIKGWTFEDCTDNIVGPDTGVVVTSDNKFRYTNQTIPGSSSLVIKFLPVDIGTGTVASIANRIFTTVYASTVSGAATYDIYYTNVGGITGNYPDFSNTATPSGDQTYTRGSSDELIVFRQGVSASGITFGPNDEASNRGLHRADTDETTPTTNGCLAIKYEKSAAGDATGALIEILQSAGAATINANDQINDKPAI